MSRHAPQRLIHIGNQRHHFLAHALPGFHHHLGQPDRVFLLLHKRPGACLHIQHQRIDALRQFLAHDGRANKPDIFDGRRDIPQRVDFLVCGCNFRGLPNQTHPAFAKNVAKFRKRQIHVESRNRFQLIERSARVSQPAAADHGNRQAACGNNGRENQRSFVAYPAR